MSDEQRTALIEGHQLFRGKDKMQAASGYHEHWPQGRGVFHNPDKTFVNWVNEGDHVRIISMQNGGDVKAVFSRLSAGAKAIEDGVRAATGIEGEVFMMHPKFGAVTCCPSNIGTGMRGSVHILVPKLIASIGFDALDKLARERHCQARGSSGEHSAVVDRIDISNWRRIGYPEYELVQDMINCANFLAAEEDKVGAPAARGASKLFGGAPEDPKAAPVAPKPSASLPEAPMDAPRPHLPKRRSSFSSTGLSAAEIATASERFAECCEALGTDSLSRPAFKMLVKQIVAEDDGVKPPKPKDLDAAFAMADANRSGSLDHEQWVVLVGLVKAGSIGGIAGKGFLTARKARRASVKFGSELEVARAEVEAELSLAYAQRQTNNRAGAGSSGHRQHGEGDALPSPPPADGWTTKKATAL
jgi:hypothetical protein